MRLEVYVEGRTYPIEVSEETVASASALFEKMDRDMDAGWKMGPEFIDRPDRYQRAQIAASRLLLAIESGNQGMIQAMAGYILARVPAAGRVYVDTTGQPLNTEICRADGSPL
jgi:hypothetical protein